MVDLNLIASLESVWCGVTVVVEENGVDNFRDLGVEGTQVLGFALDLELCGCRSYGVWVDFRSWLSGCRFGSRLGCVG